MEPITGQGPPARQYELLGLLGEGGFGAVYLARFLGEGGFEKLVAVKVLNADLEDMVEIARRLRDEARILGLLRHRSIVGVDRLTRLDGRWAVVMEYVVGEDLTQLVRRGRVPTGPALEIIADVASALHAAWHMVGPNGQPLHLLHRDLKPANIRLTPDGDVKVLDFGVARAEFDTREAATRSVAFGTPSYMPPERLDLMPDGPEGDIYALGVVLFELLTQARLPQTSANPKRHDRVLSEADQRLRALDVPPQALELVLHCMAYEPEARPKAQDLEARAVRLSRALGDDPLRTWAQRGVARAGHGYAPIGGSLSGVVLTEEPPSLLTAWERPAPRPQPARTPTPSLVPARTMLRDRTPTPPAAPPIVAPPPLLANRASLPLVEAQTMRAPVDFPELPRDEGEPTRVFPRAPAPPSPPSPPATFGVAPRASLPGVPAPAPEVSPINSPRPPPPLRMTPPSPSPPPTPPLVRGAPSGAQPSPEVRPPLTQAPQSAAPAAPLRATTSGAQPSPGARPPSALPRGQRSTPEPLPHRERGGSRALVLGAVLCGVVFGGILLAVQRLGEEEAEVVEVAPVEVAPGVELPIEPAPPEPPGEQAPPEPVPAPPEPDPVEPGPPIEREPPSDPTPPPPNKASKTKKPTARATGDASSVVLIHNTDVFDVGTVPIAVPPNDYQILASFAGGPLLSAGHVTLKAGDVVTLECLERYGRCVVDK
ncbi:MAG: serine/threonine protein kinase [Deltaproteobacteria bacterium]|nr:serine/threonine protein kinase [Deltaproteobacteria bacterium]